MRIEFDRVACAGWFNCVQRWDEFEMNTLEGKADLPDSDEVEDGVFVREVPADVEEEAREAAESCPVDAIVVYEDGEQVYP